MNRVKYLVDQDMSNFYNQSHFALLQFLVIVYENPSVVYSKLLKNRSIDESLYKLFEKVEEDSENIPEHQPTEKDLENLKLFIYMMIQLFNNERHAINLTTMTPHFLRSSETPLTHKDASKLDWEPTLNKLFLLTIHKSSLICAANYLVLNHNKQMSEIIAGSIDYYQTDSGYAKYLNQQSVQVTTHDGKRLFSLDPKHLDKFSPFYFRSIGEYYSACKIYDEYYKSKDKFELEEKLNSGPFNVNRQILSDMLYSMPISENLVDMLLKIVQLRVESGDKAVISDETLEFTLYLIAFFAFNDDQYKEVDPKNVSMKETLIAYSDLFKSAMDIGENPIFK